MSEKNEKTIGELQAELNVILGEFKTAINARIDLIAQAQDIESQRLAKHDAKSFDAAIEIQKREIAVEKRETQQKELSKHLATARCERTAALEREEVAAKKLEEVRKERDGYKAQLAKIHEAFPALMK